MLQGKFELLTRGTNSEIVLYDELVLKMVDVKYDKHTRHLRNEHSIMRQLDHPNVLSCIGYKKDVVFSADTLGLNGTWDVLFLEHAPCGSLLSHIKKQQIPAREKVQLVKQICEALYYLHIIEGVAHRDIKLDNILVKKEDSKLVPLLSDFGFAIRGTKSKEIRANSCKGTRRGYMAPELHLLPSKPQPYDAKKLDVFSFGVVIFALIFNKLPFEFATATDKYYGLIQSGKPGQFWKRHNIPESHWATIQHSQELKKLLQSMWQYEPEKRWDIVQVRDSTWLSSFQ